jgi:hypothetical protein
VEALATVDDLAAYLRQAGGAAGLDPAAAELALASASGVVRAYCRWCISAADETLTVDGDGSRLVSLPTLYLRGVLELRVGGAVVDPGGYGWSQSGQIHLLGAGWPPGFRNIDADVMHGYEETPDPVRAAVVASAARQYANPQGLLSRTVGGVSEGFASAITDLQTGQQQALLAPYRLP